MICVFLASGFEEIEALTSVDVLRRAGVNVQTIGVGNINVKGSSKIEVKCDNVIDNVDIKEVDGVILPGGMPGTENLYGSDRVKEIVKGCVEKDKLVAAICAAPIILGRMGLLNGKKACCYPGFEDNLSGAIVSDGPVCEDENIITAKGPGVSMNFAFKVLERIKGKDVLMKIRSSMQCM